MKANFPAAGFVPVALAALAALAPAYLHAQGVYRCGSSYSQTPCAAGKIVDVTDARTVAQKKLSEDTALRDAKTADAMEKARLKHEAAAAPAYIVPTRTVPADTPAAKTMKKKSLKKKSPKPQPEDFTATDGKRKEKPEKKSARPG